MTLYDAIIDTWEMGGEPSDLDPFAYDSEGDIALNGSGNYLFDETSKGYKWFLQQFNRAQLALCNWRKSNGRLVKFKEFIEKFDVVLGPDEELEGVFDFSSSTLTFDNSPDNPEEYIENMFLEILVDDVQEFNEEIPSNYNIGDLWIQSGVYRRANAANTTFSGSDWYIVASDSLSSAYLRIIEFVDLGGGSYTCYFEEGAADDYAAFKKLRIKGRLFSFKIKGDVSSRVRPYFSEMDRWPIAILNISYDGERLSRLAYHESTYDPSTAGEAPSEFTIIGNRIYFDSLFLEPYTLEFEAYLTPTTLNSYSDEFSIPSAYHECLVTWVEWRIAKRSQEYEKASYIKRDLINIINWTMSEEEFEFLRDDLGNFQVYRED